jgi:hypothetical protein
MDIDTSKQIFTEVNINDYINNDMINLANESFLPFNTTNATEKKGGSKGPATPPSSTDTTAPKPPAAAKG